MSNLAHFSDMYRIANLALTRPRKTSLEQDKQPTTYVHARAREDRHPTKLTELDFQRQLVATKPNPGIAIILGWESVHFRPLRTISGWQTPGSGSMAKGWPDLTLARGDRLVFAELKREGEKPTVDQLRVLKILAAAGGEAYVWYPSDLERIAEILR